MKIGIQAWYLSQPYTGIGQHTLGLLRALTKENGVELIIASPNKISLKGVPSKFIKTIKTKWWLFHPSLKKWYWERVQAPAFFAKVNPDWEYYPYPCPLPRYSPNLRALTVHDMIPWTDDRYKGGRLKSIYYNKARRSIVRADHIFAVSEATYKDLDIPAASILPNAIPEIPKNLPKLSYQNSLVYLGGYDKRKNVPALVQAFQKVKKEFPQMQLILIGAPHHSSKYYPEIPEQEGVHQLGKVSNSKLYAVLKSAFAFVHFSDAEGFNIPLLQAMSIGTPAIVMDIPVNREVSNGTALFMKGSQKNELFAKVKLLLNEKKRNEQIKEQKQAAKRFGWDKTAKIFIKTLSNGKRPK